MKSIIVTVFLSASVSFAGILPGKSLPPSKHEIVTSYPQDDLKAGTCKIIGHVYNGWEKDAPMAGTLVSTLNMQFSDKTDSTGYYEFIMSAKDTSIFAFKSEFTEHVIWNHEFKEYHVYEINFYLVVDYNMMIVDKPVIYLYSEEDLSVNIQFDPTGDLTFTYPEYKDAWNVKIEKNQIINEGNSYPYLFWESSTHTLDYDTKNDRIYGQMIETTNAVQFLEASLDELGLNYTEQADFITYWLPRLQSKEYAFVQFILDDDYQNSISEMTVSPKPDNMKRVFMLFTLFDEKPKGADFSNQELKGFERNGFTLVEWGGAQKNQCKAFEYEVVEK